MANHDDDPQRLGLDMLSFFKNTAEQMGNQINADNVTDGERVGTSAFLGLFKGVADGMSSSIQADIERDARLRRQRQRPPQRARRNVSHDAPPERQSAGTCLICRRPGRSMVDGVIVPVCRACYEEQQTPQTPSTRASTSLTSNTSSSAPSAACTAAAAAPAAVPFAPTALASERAALPTNSRELRARGHPGTTTHPRQAAPADVRLLQQQVEEMKSTQATLLAEVRNWSEQLGAVSRNQDLNLTEQRMFRSGLEGQLNQAFKELRRSVELQANIHTDQVAFRRRVEEEFAVIAQYLDEIQDHQDDTDDDRSEQNDNFMRNLPAMVQQIVLDVNEEAAAANEIHPDPFAAGSMDRVDQD